MNTLNHHHLYLFWVFSKHENFTKTAKELSISQSAVTMQIRRLEEILGLSLVNRSNPRKPTLTEEGMVVLSYAEKIFESSRELLNWATHGESQKQQILKIGAASNLSRNLQFEFVRPTLSLKNTATHVIHGDQRAMISLLSSHEIDVYLTTQAVGELNHESLYSQTIYSSPYIFASATKPKSLTLTQVRAYFKQNDLYLPSATSEARPLIEEYLVQNQIPYNLKGEIDDVALLRIIALQPKTIVAIPEIGAKTDLVRKSLYQILRPDGIAQRYYAITRDKLKPKGLVKDLISDFKGRFKH